jgi:glycosyltransferase involved in cell wall biosynthesis
VSVIPNGCDTELFDVPASVGEAFRRGHGWLGDRPLVTYTGTLGTVNGVAYFARLAAETQRLNAEVRFLVVGSGKEDALVRATAAELGVLDRSFFMLPSLPKRELPACLSATDVATSFVIDVPALWTNSANKFFDAFAARRPMLINHEGWLADVLRRTGSGIVVPPADARAAAVELCAFLGDPARIARARAAAGELAAGEFNRDRLAGELLDVFRRAAGANS